MMRDKPFDGCLDKEYSTSLCKMGEKWFHKSSHLINARHSLFLSFRRKLKMHASRLRLPADISTGSYDNSPFSLFRVHLDVGRNDVYTFVCICVALHMGASKCQSNLDFLSHAIAKSF